MTPRPEISVTAVATRHFLVPDLDGELHAHTEAVDELLLGLAEWADDEPTDLPKALHRPASDALGDIRTALNDAAHRPLYAPDGHHEHEPLTVIELPATTIATYGAAVAELARAVHGAGDPTVTGAIREFTDEWHRPITPAALVETAARLHGVCDLAWGPDEQLIGTRLDPANHPGNVNPDWPHLCSSVWPHPDGVGSMVVQSGSRGVRWWGVRPA